MSNPEPIDQQISPNYQLLYENSPLGYQSLDVNGNFIIVNRAWCDLLGYSESEVLGKWFGDFLVPESRDKVLENFPKFKAAGRICGIEFKMLCKDGSSLDVAFDGRIGYDEQGGVKQTHCIIQDISEKKQKQALEASFKNIFENSLNEIFVFDAFTLKFIKVNRGACNNIGYSPEELSQLTPLDIKPEFTLDKFNELIEPLRLGEQEMIQFESVHQRKNGSLYFIEVHLQLSTFLEKPAFVAIILDVTKRKEIENRLQLVIQGADLGYWDWDYVTGKHQVNDRWLEMLGLSSEDLDDYVGDWESRLHPDDRQQVINKLYNCIELKKPYVAEFRMRHKLGYWVWILSSGSVVAYDIDNKSPLRLCGTHQDITVRKQTDEKIRQLSRAVEQSPNLVLITDIDGNIEYANPQIYEITGYTVDDVIGKNTRIFRSDETESETYEQLWVKIKSGQNWHGSLHNRRKNGDLFWVQESIAPIRDEHNDITHLVSIQVDITEAKKVSEQLNYHATHDPLTGLINRREFENRVNRIIDTAKQNDSAHVLCYLDLDQFKIINDTCTHVAGDELLKQFASILTSTFRHRDTIGRLGGDEFAVLLEHCAVQQAEKIAEQLLQTVGQFQFHWDNKSFRIGVSIGIVAINRHTDSLSALLSHSDIACYAAKHAGRHCIHIYQQSDRDLAIDHKELQWISRINQALNEDLLLLYIQPICRADNYADEPDHYEVLIRLRDGEDGIISPGAFLPAVERFNLSSQLDQWVIKAVFDWMAEMAQQNRKSPCFSVNLSGQNLGNKHLLGFIKELHVKLKIPADKICFEITETAAINNLTDARAFIAELSGNGFKFSLDDFGSGLSSFDYLRNLPVDYLKIDGQFVRNIEHDEIDYALVKSIHEIGTVMGKKTIAEFVENENILHILKGLNVDYLQGYYLGKARPLNDWPFIN